MSKTFKDKYTNTTQQQQQQLQKLKREKVKARRDKNNQYKQNTLR